MSKYYNELVKEAESGGIMPDSSAPAVLKELYQNNLAVCEEEGYQVAVVYHYKLGWVLMKTIKGHWVIAYSEYD